MATDSMDTNNNPSHMQLDKSIISATDIFDSVLLSNDLDTALEKIEPYVSNSIYHSFFKAAMLIVLAISSMDQSEIDKASKAVDDLAKLTNKYRKHGLLISAMKIIKTPNYQKYSDLELHSELLHTYYLAMSALMCGVETHNIYGLIKVAYRLQKFIKNFKGCRVILKKRKQWDNEVTKLNFEVGVRFANGLKHLAISQIPPKILRIINFLGYRGKESIGFDEINRAAFELPGAGARLARMFLIGYWFYGLPHGALVPKDLPNCEQILLRELEKYPKSIVFLGAKAKFEQISGRIDSAIALYSELQNTTFIGAYKAFQFELMFCYALKCDWNQCIKYAELVRKGTEHSPTYTTYAEAVFRYVKSIEENDVTQKQIASKLMEIIPSLRIRHLGKTLTPEKVAVECSIKYFKNDEFLILPEMDLLWQGNWLSFIRGDTQMLNKLMTRVNKEFNHFKDDIIGSDYLDNYLTAVFYKGVINKLLGHFDEARDCFNTILKDESRFGREFSIPVQAVLELGLTELELGNHEAAKKWLNKTINDYSGYLNENYVHLRAYAGLREMGISTDKDKEDEIKLEQYKKEWLKEINVEEKSYETILQKEEEIVVK